MTTEQRPSRMEGAYEQVDRRLGELVGWMRVLASAVLAMAGGLVYLASRI